MKRTLWMTNVAALCIAMVGCSAGADDALPAQARSVQQALTPASCLTVTEEGPTYDNRWKQGVAVNNDYTVLGKYIVGYQIQWFNGLWSPVYTPGVDDIDWVTNYDGTQRRVWSYFYDHTHRYYTGDTVEQGATGDSRWTQGTSLDLDNQLIGKDIVSHRIQWSDGSWSRNFTPGADDIDWVTNYDGTQRRVWSYFTDHTHRYVTCPAVAPPPPPGGGGGGGGGGGCIRRGASNGLIDQVCQNY